MKMPSLCAASSRKTGSGKWRPWTAADCEGLGCLVLPLGWVWVQSWGVTWLLCMSYGRLTLWLPDSMTTWEIHGVSLSRSKGDLGLLALFPSP